MAQQPTTTAAPPRLKEVIVVYKTHFDIGFTALTREVVERYRTTMIDKALGLVDRSKDLPPDQRFVWTIPGWPLTQTLWEGQTAERRNRIMEALHSGQFVFHALPLTTHTESLDIEDLVRGMDFSSRLARGLGVELPRDAKMTDVPSHSWILPTMLKHAGVEFLHLGSNRMSNGPEFPAAATFGKIVVNPNGGKADQRQNLFWWEGPDGSRLLTMYSRAYGSGIVPPEDWPYSTWLALIHTGDNAGPPTPEAVQKILEEAREKLPGVKIRFGRLSDFADALLKENPKLPVIRGDMPDPWIHGVMTMPAEMALIRNARPQIGALESLNTLLGVWTNQPAAAAKIAEAYEQSLLFSEHTWGYDAKRFPRSWGAQWEADRAAGKFVRLEESWNEHRRYAGHAAEIAGTQLEANLTALSAAAGVAGRRIAVFNSLPWRRDGVVEAPFAGAPPKALRDAQTGSLVPVEIAGGKLRFIARDVPPLGYRTYAFDDRPAPANPGLTGDEKTGLIENQYLRVRLDPAEGRIASVVDKSAANRELVDKQAESGFGQYIHEQFSADDADRFVRTYTKGTGRVNYGDFGKQGMPPATEWPHRLDSPRHFTLRIERGPVSVSAVMEAAKTPAIPYRTALVVTLYDGQPFVALEWRIDGKPGTPMPEGGWLSFPLAVSNPRFRLARLGSVIDPADETIEGTNHSLYGLTGGVAVLDANQTGAALCPLDSPLVSLDHPGLWEYVKTFASTKPQVFVNLYNNLWGTNFPQWIEGSWSSRVRLWGVQKYQEFSSVVQPSLEARTPLYGAMADGAGGKLPAAKAGLRISRPGVLVTAFGKNPDGPGRVLRLWEQAGRDGTVGVCLAEGSGVSAVEPADLRGRAAGKPLQVSNGCFTTQLAHDAPASFILR
jgi:hypothetical protein